MTIALVVSNLGLLVLVALLGRALYLQVQNYDTLARNCADAVRKK